MRLRPHPNIARIYEIFQLGPQNQALIVMERLRSGSLLTALNDSSFYLNGQSCIQLSAEIASALLFCHLNGILHLDVKPSNILIDFQNHCKLSDFGNSKNIQDLMSGTNFAKVTYKITTACKCVLRAKNLTAETLKSLKCHLHCQLCPLCTQHLHYNNDNNNGRKFTSISLV